MIITRKIIDCQSPADETFYQRKFTIVRCVLKKGELDYEGAVSAAKEMARSTSSGYANDSAYRREIQRKEIDAFSGIITEKGWELFLNYLFGPVAAPTPFVDINKQIDIRLSSAKVIEVRSSFVRNGVKFGLCSERHNFRNIGPYQNSIKPGEIQKDYYCGALITSEKSKLLDLETVEFYLVGSSTWEMMMTIGHEVTLSEDNHPLLTPGNYRVIEYINTLDVGQFVNHLVKEECYSVINRLDSLSVTVYC